MTIGERIKKVRKQRDWTQWQLAEKIGVHPAHVTRWEKGRVKPSAKMLLRITKALELKEDELITDNGKAGLEACLSDPVLLSQFQAIQALDEEEKRAVQLILDAMITKHQVRSLITKGEAGKQLKAG